MAANCGPRVRGHTRERLELKKPAGLLHRATATGARSGGRFCRGRCRKCVALRGLRAPRATATACGASPANPQLGGQRTQL